MKFIYLFLMINFFSNLVIAQKTTKPKSTKTGSTKTVHGRKHVDERAPSKIQGSSNNAGQIIYAQRSAMGYRIMVLTTDNRDYAMKTRSKLLSRYPDQKPYMVYTAPTIKIKFGNFLTKEEAERYKTNIKISGIVSSAMYLIPEPVEVKPPARQPNAAATNPIPTTTKPATKTTSNSVIKTSTTNSKPASKSKEKKASTNVAKPAVSKPKTPAVVVPAQKKPVLKPA